MKNEIEKLILQELETELGFRPDEESAKDCIEYVKRVIARRVVDLMGETDWKYAARMYKYPA